MLIILLSIVGGLVGLAIGGELLVRGATGIALKAGLSHLVTGVVIVGAATSMPEMVASVQGALAGSPGIAWGNIVGSNISNTLLILGAGALIAPIALSGAGKRDAVAGLAAVALLWALAVAGVASPWIGAGLLALLVIYIVWRVAHPSKAHDYEEEEEGAPDNIALAIVLFLAGLAALIIGGSYLVSGAIELARIVGLSEAVIGLTIVAIGTSLPELAATVAAAARGKSALALGNVVGSNVFNLLLIGGVTMTIAPLPITPELNDLEWPLLAVVSLLLVLICRYVHRLGRLAGAALVAAFGAYVLLVLA